MSDARKDTQPVKDHRQIDREAEQDAQARIVKAVSEIRWEPSSDGTVVVAPEGKTA